MGWIPLTTELPPLETDVLCKRSNGLPPIVCGFFFGEYKDWHDLTVYGITDWMPLPEDSYSSPSDGVCAERVQQ